MAEAIQQPPSAQALRQGYESSIVSNRGLLIFLVCFVLGGVVIQAGLWAMMKCYASVPRPFAPDSAVPQVDVFADPRLQPSQEHPFTPSEDLAALRESDRRIFEQLGWKTDGQTDLPAIPDDIVKQLAAKQSAGRKP